MTVKARLRRVLLKGAVLLSAGGVYAVWVKRTGLGIPCVFHLVTGLKCTGCGVTRMLLSLLRLDFAAALDSNAVLACMLPFLLVLAAVSLVRYVRTGGNVPGRGENAAVLAAVAVLVIWGAVRNIPGVPFG